VPDKRTIIRQAQGLATLSRTLVFFHRRRLGSERRLLAVYRRALMSMPGRRFRCRGRKHKITSPVARTALALAKPRFFPAAHFSVSVAFTADLGVMRQMLRPMAVRSCSGNAA
jgi:hypothetical protein